MGVNIKCPKCGGYHVQLSNERGKHGLLWFLIFWIFYLIWIFCKWCIGFIIFITFDWWMWVIKKLSGKGYVWKSKGWFAGTKKIYYCHDCGYNFRA